MIVAVNEWDRQRDEPATPFAWFVVYRDLGPSRSLVKARNIYTGGNYSIPAGCQMRDSKKYNWVARSAAFDAYRDKVRQEAYDKFANEETGSWAKERKEHRKREAEIAKLLFHKAKAALEMCDVKTLEPINIARFLVVADRLFRLGANMPMEPGEEIELDSDAGLFNTPEDMVKALPAGSIPSPADVNEKPEIRLSEGGESEEQKAIDRPQKLRPM